MPLLFTLVFLALFALVAVLHTNWKKPTTWLVVNVATLVAFGFLSVVMNNLYLVVGLICSLGMVADMFWWKKVPLKANFMKYVRTFFMTVCFFPVVVFEEVYSSIHPTLPTVPPTV
jgi:hypothetical protein